MPQIRMEFDIIFNIKRKKQDGGENEKI